MGKLHEPKVRQGLRQMQSWDWHAQATTDPWLCCCCPKKSAHGGSYFTEKMETQKILSGGEPVQGGRTPRPEPWDLIEGGAEAAGPQRADLAAATGIKFYKLSNLSGQV